jgi:predicted acyltransferase
VKVERLPGSVKPPPNRLVSVNAFRGFDIFGLIGGHTILKALVAWMNWKPLTVAAHREMQHPLWSGFHWWDVIMPTFIFISGVTIPLAITWRPDEREPQIGDVAADAFRTVNRGAGRR